MARNGLTDTQWERIRPLPPPEKGPMGRPSISHRKFLDALFWLVRTGAPWRDLPAEYGPWASVATRFYRWNQNGILLRLFKSLLQEADGRGLLDWEMHCVDSSVIRAHQHAAGGKKGLQEPSGAAAEGSARKSTCALIAKATRSLSRSRAAKSMTHRSS